MQIFLIIKHFMQQKLGLTHILYKHLKQNNKRDIYIKFKNLQKVHVDAVEYQYFDAFVDVVQLTI